MHLILDVFLIFAAAKTAGEIFVRLRQPAIVGELLVGVLIGPHVLGWVDVHSGTRILSELGIVVLLFTAGLEMRLGDLLAVGRVALAVSVTGMVAAGAAGFVVVSGFGYDTGAAALTAVALAATSVGIAARAFAEMGALAARSARVVLGAAVVDDVVVLAVLPLVQGAGDDGSTGSIIIGLAGAVAFIVLVTTIGPRLARRHGGAVLESPRIRRSPFVLALVLCLGLAALAEEVGLAALIGAFLAGMVLAETEHRHHLERQMEPLFDFLVPFFFVVTAAQMDPGALGEAGVPFLVALVGTTVVAKLVGCGAGAVGLPMRERAAVGSGMLPRGEVTLAVGTAGLAAGTIPVEVFSAIVAAVLVSTVLAPPLMKASVPASRRQVRRGRAIPPEGFDVDEDPGSL